MAAVKDIRVRIESVESVAKITKTLSLIASSALTKCKRELAAVEERLKVLQEPVQQILGKLQNKGADFEEQDPKHRILIVVGSEKGLCGPFNSRIAKSFASNYQPYKYSKVVLLGKKLFSKIRLEDSLNLRIPNSLASLGEISFYLSEIFLKQAEPFNASCEVIYSRFKNLLTLDPAVVKPISPTFFLSFFLEAHQRLGRKLDDSIFPQKVYKLYLSTFFHYALISSRASEEAARVVAMDSATKNSEDLAQSLTLKMNKLRQDAITRQLIEIISGAQELRT